MKDSNTKAVNEAIRAWARGQEETIVPDRATNPEEVDRGLSTHPGRVSKKEPPWERCTRGPLEKST